MSTNLSQEQIDFASDVYENHKNDYDSCLSKFKMIAMGDEGAFKELKERFPRPAEIRPIRHYEADESEDYAEGLLEYPPDTEPLSKYGNHGWIDDEQAEKFRKEPRYRAVKAKTGIKDTEVLDDIQENTIHILGRCNNPKDWGENKRGLVYGMVQSGKTASMINLIAMGICAGYRLFVLLAGDKNSLRNQSQQRINEAFELTNGFNHKTGVYSATYASDFKDSNEQYMGNFKLRKIVNGDSIINIIVIKKEKHHLEQLVTELGQVKQFCDDNDLEFSEHFTAMILDDEADSASQDTNPEDGGTTIHNNIVEVRNSLPKNCYVAYTATPQACLSADTDDPIGYPKDFFWLLEPFMEEKDGRDVNRSYLGAWDMFWEYDSTLIQIIDRNEWPTYVVDEDGDTKVWMPHPSGNSGDYLDDGENQDEAQEEYLDGILDGTRPIPKSLYESLADYLIGCGLRWWSHWKQKDTTYPTPPTQVRITTPKNKYPHHAIMIHLSRLAELQLKAREIAKNAWEDVCSEWHGFDFDTSPSDHLFHRRWKDQVERTDEFKGERGVLDFKEIKPFIEHAISISEIPIHDHRSAGFPTYPGKPYIYMVNSKPGEGNRLAYDEDTTPRKLLTKKASIIVGGQILSRGLTIQGLSVSFFGRTAKLPMGDSVLQMGRWFGHKKDHMDLIKVYMPEVIKVLFRDIADADKELRRQIKFAILNDLSPEQILIELRNSPQFRATSSAKSKFVNSTSGGGFSGKRAILLEPTFNLEAIRQNKKLLEGFKSRNKGTPSNKRATVYHNVAPAEVIKLLESFTCKKFALKDSFADYARYLKDWRDGENMPDLPAINIAIMDGLKIRKRRFSTTDPSSPKDARKTVQPMFSPFIGGSVPHEVTPYRGDGFIDRDANWHKSNPNASQGTSRQIGEDILIVFYEFEPNYLTKSTVEKGVRTNHKGGIYLQSGDRLYIDVPAGKEADYPVITFAAFTPLGGPQYSIGVNSALDPKKIQYVGTTSNQSTGDEEE